MVGRTECGTSEGQKDGQWAYCKERPRWEKVGANCPVRSIWRSLRRQEGSRGPQAQDMLSEKHEVRGWL